MDLNPLTTPNSILTDCLNGTIITYNGNEFVLQNDMGNCKIDQARMPPGFIPMGMKEYGGVIYIAAYNPITGEGQFGSCPSPRRDFSTTDHDNIGPVNFKDSQFVVETSTQHEGRTKVVGKLFEPELFTLHPGDMYIVTYDINEPAGGNPSLPDDINNETKYENYISKNPNDRKLFALRFYKITDDNNLTLLDSTRIKVIPDQDDLDDEYVYFPENSNATLAVGLEIEQLDFFEVNVIDRSLKTNSDKKVAIEAIGGSNSLSTFQGVKVDVTLPSTETFFIDKTGSGKKVSAIIDGLSAGDKFQCSVTPYSPYCLFPKLKKDFVLTLGTYTDGSTGVNNIFRYYTDLSNNYLKIDFDYQFQGDTEEGIHLYVEIYDPWSDYSILKTVDNPTYYGTNTVTIEFNNEVAIDQFDSTTVGGTPPDKLTANTDTEYEKTLLNSTNLIRIDQTLRKNHFYIVRISGVDRLYDSDTETFTYAHYDLYKGLYTNTMFNSIYALQGGLSSTDPSYVPDFNQLDFDISQLGYTSSITPASSVDLNPIVTTQRDDLTTDGKYYKISPSALSTSTAYKYNKLFESKRGYNISMALTGTETIFGNFKQELLSISLPTIQDSDGSTSGVIKPTIADSGFDGNSNIAPNSVARWQLATVTDKSAYTLSTDVTTSRSIYAPVGSTTKTARVYKAVSLLPSLYYRSNADGLYNENKKATIRINKYDVDITRENSTNYSSHHDFSPQDNKVLDDINAAGLARTYSAFIMTSSEKTWGYGGATDYNSCNDSVPVAAWKQCNMLIKGTDSGYYRLTKTIDADAIVQFFSSLYVASNVSSTVNVYYPNSSTLVANGNIATTASFPDLTFTTNFTPNTVGSDYVRTYLSTFRMHATNQLTDFRASTLNNYIASRLGDSSIIDGKQTVRDGFIPYIDVVQQSTDIIAVDPVTITQAADSSIVTKYISGQTQYTTDPMFSEAPHLHGELFTDKPEYYGSVLTNFTVNNVFANTPIDQNAVFISAKAGLQAWSGNFALAGRCKSDNPSPSLFPVIAISKQ
jgi:hypothetical protein